MYKIIVIIISLFLLSNNCSLAQKITDIDIEVPVTVDFEKIRKDKNQVKHSLNDLIVFMEDSIAIKSKVVLPENLTEFEKLLCTARRIQHNDSQLVAIKMIKTLLEFECYRTKGEEMYLRLMLGNSLSYIGAPQIAKSYINNIFPDILNEFKSPEIKSNLLDNYALILIRVDSIEAAKKIYQTNLKISTRAKHEKQMFNARNNLGYAYMKLGKLDSAKTLFRKNQNSYSKEISPVLYAFSFGNYGGVLIKEEKYDSAAYYLHKEIQLLDSINSNEGINHAYSDLAEIYEKKEILDTAKYYYTLALEVSIEESDLPQTVKNLENLMRIYTVEKSAPELKALLNSYFSYQKQLNSEIRLSATKEEYKVSRFLKILNEAEESKKNNDLLKTNNDELIRAIVVLGIVVFMLILVITVRNINRRKLKAKNQELKEKNILLKESNQIISESNTRNEVLLKELHHRVKNNLQIISSLFNLQLNATKLDIAAEKVFRDAQNRIHSISLVHKKIYQSDNIDSLDFEEYIRDFSGELLKTTPNDVNIEISIQRNPLSIDSAIPLGLIFNELLTNSLKHAKPHDLLKISIHYSQEGDKERFVYTDNGVGVENIELMKESGNSIGVTLIHLLGKQLNAKIKYKEAKDSKQGFWLSIEGNFT